MIQKIKIWADKFENKTAKIVAFYSALIAFISIFPTIITFVYFSYNLIIDLYNISTYVKQFTKATEYNNFMNMQLSSVIHGELDSKVVYGIRLEQTNLGDYYYFDTININGVVRPIIYSANVKKKAHTNGANIYVQDMNGNHKWIQK